MSIYIWKNFFPPHNYVGTRPALVHHATSGSAAQVAPERAAAAPSRCNSSFLTATKKPRSCTCSTRSASQSTSERCATPVSSLHMPPAPEPAHSQHNRTCTHVCSARARQLNTNAYVHTTCTSSRCPMVRTLHAAPDTCTLLTATRIASRTTSERLRAHGCCSTTTHASTSLPAGPPSLKTPKNLAQPQRPPTAPTDGTVPDVQKDMSLFFHNLSSSWVCRCSSRPCLEGRVRRATPSARKTRRKKTKKRPAAPARHTRADGGTHRVSAHTRRACFS